jgi:hypothetical protein
VTDATTGQGIAGAAVEAWPVELHTQDFSATPWSGGNYSARTASDGSYALFGLPVGDYVVRVTAPGYAREYYDNVIASHEAETIHVAALRETPGIDFKLTEGGSISGHIYQSDGVTPIASAEVNVRPSKYRFDQGFWAKTDADGVYTVRNLSLGDFRVRASAEGYATTYYSDVYSWSNALNVVVTPPDDTFGIDISLDLAGSISGYVYASDGVTPIPHVLVMASAHGITPLGEYSDSDGSYIIRGIPQGNYSVGIQATSGWYAGEFYDSRLTSSTVDQFVVSAGHNTPNINFTLDEGGWITGHVFDEDTGEPLEDIILYGYLPNGDCCTTPTSHTLYDGSYRFVLKPGEYLISAGMKGYAPSVLGYKYVPEWYDNAYDMSHATLVNVTLHNETSGIDIYLAKSGSISGHVYDEEGNPVGDASVYAFSDVYPGNGANTQAEGSYTIEGLLSGNYVVQVTMSGYVSEYYDGVNDPGSATQVTVNAPDDAPGIDFRLSRASE